MPQELVCVYYALTGEPCFMHSVDAAEALRLGDYVSAPLSGKVDDAALARAMQRASGMGAVSHPELQSPEERQAHRDEANKMAAMTAMQAAMQHPMAMSMMAAPVPMVHGLAPEPQPLDVTHGESVSAQVQADAVAARKR